jgi:hypothetical protein
MRAKSLLCLGVILGLLLMVQPAHAVNFSGKIQLVQVTSGLRFLAAGSPLNLFATGDAKEVLLQAFYAKAHVDIGYTVVPCTGGITGTCGTVNFVSVNSANLP